jgi:predicted house-cleaning noncanonical NTP pyrophosphatase (MazG superfamily)
MRVDHGKLVRDRIPAIIESHGYRAVAHTPDEDSYRTALLAKLAEEAHEAQQATADDFPAELADVLEVLQALTAAFGLTWDQLQELAADKRAHRGGFRQRLFLDYVDQPE